MQGMIPGMDAQQQYMTPSSMFGNQFLYGTHFDYETIGGQQMSTQQNSSGNGSSGYPDQNQQYMSNQLQGNNTNQNDYFHNTNNPVDTTGYQQMMRGAGGMDMSNFQGANMGQMAGMMGGMGFPGQMGGSDMVRMNQFGGYPNMGGQMPTNQHENTQNSQQDTNRNNQNTMMDMSQMQNMGQYGYAQPNQMMGFQNMTPEQQMQMMRYGGMGGAMGGQMGGQMGNGPMNNNNMNNGGN